MVLIWNISAKSRTIIGMNVDLHKKALWLSYFTVAYNIAEGLLSIIFGLLAGSIALVGFGLDSVIESLSGFVMIWRFRKHGKISQEDEEKVEQRATKLIGVTFFILGAYVLYESIKKLVIHEVPDPSMIGIAIAIASIIVMPILFYMKRKTAKAIGSKSLAADAKETLVCCFLSIALLIGLGANYIFGLWQADPIVGIIIVVLLFREGLETLRGEEDED
jgi:cation diffusion facilitator family transporter